MPRKRKEPRVPAKIEPELARISSGFDLFAMDGRKWSNDLHVLKPGRFPFQVHTGPGPQPEAGAGPACLGAVTDRPARIIDQTLDWYFRDRWVTYRETPRGVDVLAVGPDEIGRLMQSGLSQEDLLSIRIRQI